MQACGCEVRDTSSSRSGIWLQHYLGTVQCAQLDVDTLHVPVKGMCHTCEQCTTMHAVQQALLHVPCAPGISALRTQDDGEQRGWRVRVQLRRQHCIHSLQHLLILLPVLCIRGAASGVRLHGWQPSEEHAGAEGVEHSQVAGHHLVVQDLSGGQVACRVTTLC